MKLNLILFLFAGFALNSSAQNTISTTFNHPYNASDVYLTYNKVVFTDAKNMMELSPLKFLIKTVLFNNGLFITYSFFKVETIDTTNYNSTISFVNGDFITAKIIRISTDTISYQSPLSNDILFLSTKDIIEINYVNGVCEYFTSNDKYLQKN